MFTKTGFETLRFPPCTPLYSQMPMPVAVQRCRQLQEYIAASDTIYFLQRIGYIQGRKVFHAICGDNGMKRRVSER